MNESAQLNVAWLLRSLVACIPLGLGCCVAPYSDSSSAAAHSTEPALIIEPGSRPTIWVDETTDVTITRVQGGYDVEANVQTDNDHSVQLSLNPEDNQPVTIPRKVQGQPIPVWWYSTDSAGNGTVTIDEHNPKKITSVMGRNTSGGAFFVFTDFAATGNIRMTVWNNGPEPAGTPVFEDISWPTDPASGAPDSYTLQPQTDGSWKLEIVDHGKKLSIPITYVP